jgi:hypothetical protein
VRNFPGGDFDLSGMDATPFEIGAVLDAVSEADAEAGTGAYDPDGQAAADWAASLTDAEYAELEARYEADTALPGPELAGADVGGVIDLAADMSAVDAILATMTDREHARQAQDAAETGKRRGSTEIRLSNALNRVAAGTYLYGGQPATDLANWQGGGFADDQFGTSLNAAEVTDHMRYQLRGGAKPQGRGQFAPPVRDLARQIGLR